MNIFLTIIWFIVFAGWMFSIGRSLYVDYKNRDKWDLETREQHHFWIELVLTLCILLNLISDFMK